MRAVWLVVFLFVANTIGERMCVQDELLGELCLSITWQDNCHLDVIIEVNSEEIIQRTTITQQLVDTTVPECTNTLGCELCIEWDAQIDNTGGGSWNAIFSGACLSESVIIGPFVASPLTMCKISCPSSCSGYGQCQNSGECDCGPGHYGLDCSSTHNCNSSRTSIAKITENFYEKILPAGTQWLSYSTGYQPLAELVIEVNISEEDSVSIWTMKSCHPTVDGNFYDNEYLGKTGTIFVHLADHCDTVFGGIWFLLFQCDSSGPCNFSVRVHEQRIESLYYEEPKEIAVSDSRSYYSIEITPEGLWENQLLLELTGSLPCAASGVELLPLYCPTDTFAFARVNIPLDIVAHPEHSVCKYKVAMDKMQAGLWYIAVLGENEGNMWLTASHGNCNGTVCVHGYCNSYNECECFIGVEGDMCDQVGGSYQSYVEDPTDENVNTEDAPSLSEIIASIVVFTLIGILIIVLIAVVANYLFVRRRRRNQPADNLFNMLTQEQDLDTL